MQQDHDGLLPLSRRLDWRFLLPDPTLGRVIYLGPRDTVLLEALQRFSREVVQSTDLQADLAVMVNPSVADFAHVLSSVRAFYVELHRPTWPNRIIHAAAPATFLRHARNHSFQAQPHWHYPDFETANRIVPLSASGPLLHVIAKDRHDLKTRLKVRGVAWLLKSGLLARAVFGLSIVGFKA